MLARPSRIASLVLLVALAAPRAALAQSEGGRQVEASVAPELQTQQRVRERLSQRDPRWRPEFRRFSVGGYIAASSSGALALTLSLTWDAPDTPSWTRRNTFDLRARDRLRANGATQRRAGLTSDVLLWSLVAYPFADAIGAGLGTGGDPEVAWQMVLMDAQAHAFTMLMSVLIKRTFARERPFARECGGPTPHFSCDAADVHQSFYSGHTATAFTAAGLACAHHRAQDLYHRRRAGRFACAMSMSAAATVGVLRMVADEHYLSDVLVGGGVGLLSGYAFATLYHYRRFRWLSGTTSVVPMPMVSRDTVGLSVSGSVDL